ncbi:LPS export ABC transporter permease LptF [Marinagarivorans cellulosilyticus]|uniref:Lipopolysaccharide export system permease protein LptF n=1 Tax=Marinagarivorans cellulosilyticus TaxID=2721545 RepID=A0AAN2BLX0_9GAMM|nr:LPS export ABC transporter permease LptF [Marinagarivorans cellulosilyticus]BCD99529.1 lipopolysaccharide export system permease protein [Marinagarivorans cellulosilyticus]
MIIFRYLAKEVLTSMAAVCSVLLLIILSGRFVRYLAEAAAGKLEASVLFTLMGFRLPSYLELIIPLALFIGILLAYGRLYVDSEMTVLKACGMSERQLVAYTVVIALSVACLVGFFSLYLGPVGAKASSVLIEEQRSRTEFETLKPAYFHRLSGGGVSYAEQVSEDKKRLQNVFLASPGDQERRVSLMTAKTGETIVDQLSGRRYLVLSDGYQYHGTPGQSNYEVVSFRSYAQFLPDSDYQAKQRDIIDAMSTRELWEANTLQASSALQWRLSMPALVMIVALLAVPLSRTQPRRGRYAKMIPAILLYVIYLVACNAARGLLDEGKAPTPWLLWVVHLGFLNLALVMLVWPALRLPRRKQAKGPSATVSEGKTHA